MTKEKKKAVDIADFDTGVASDKGYDLELLHPTNNKPLGVFITVLGKHSEIFREYIREQINDRSRKEAAAQRKNNPLPPQTAEEAERTALESLVVSTTGWFTADVDRKTGEISNKVPTFTYRGDELPFTTANAFRVYSEQIWVRGQVDEAIGDLENFIKGLAQELANYAEAEFELNRLHKDGSSERANLEAGADQGNQEAIAALAKVPKLPETARYLWEYFKQLHVTRNNGMSVASISYTEIEAWSRLRHVKLDPWELEAILWVDSLFIASCAKTAPTLEG